MKTILILLVSCTLVNSQLKGYPDLSAHQRLALTYLCYKAVPEYFNKILEPGKMVEGQIRILKPSFGLEFVYGDTEIITSPGFNPELSTIPHLLRNEKPLQINGLATVNWQGLQHIIISISGLDNINYYVSDKLEDRELFKRLLQTGKLMCSENTFQNSLLTWVDTPNDDQPISSQG